MLENINLFMSLLMHRLIFSFLFEEFYDDYFKHIVIIILLINE